MQSKNNTSLYSDLHCDAACLGALARRLKISSTDPLVIGVATQMECRSKIIRRRLHYKETGIPSCGHAVASMYVHICKRCSHTVCAPCRQLHKGAYPCWCYGLDIAIANTPTPPKTAPIQKF